MDDLIRRWVLTGIALASQVALADPSVTAVDIHKLDSELPVLTVRGENLCDRSCVRTVVTLGDTVLDLVEIGPKKISAALPAVQEGDYAVTVTVGSQGAVVFTLPIRGHVEPGAVTTTLDSSNLRLRAVGAGNDTPGDLDSVDRWSGLMVRIPAGVYDMGDPSGEAGPDERPVHAVRVPAFRIGRTEVTRGQFRRFVEDTGYRTDAEKNERNAGCLVTDGTATPHWAYRAHTDWLHLPFSQTDDHPVVCVTFRDVQAYLDWLNSKTHGHFRLPSEAEWEYVARGGSMAPYPWGSAYRQGCAYANAADEGSHAIVHWSQQLPCSDGAAYTASVASYRANPSGVHDLIGNVWEWTADCYHPNYVGAPSDGSAWSSVDCRIHEVRGGAWNSAPASLRVSSRTWNEDFQRTDTVGFRLAED